MAKPGVIRGVVVDAGGRPIAGARVSFRSGPGPLPDIAALTARDGSFAVTAPAAGTYELAAVGDEGAPGTATVAVAPGETATVTLRLGGRG
jgi:hypothetical protein